jgi:general secretion pathway protein J
MRRRNAGFTMLEMLVALVVFALLMAGIAQAMQYGMAVWSVEARQEAVPEAMSAVDAALRRLIEQVEPGTLVGSPDGMAFTAPLPAGSGLADPLADLAILVTPDHRLALYYAPHPAGILLGPTPRPQTEFLLDDVIAIHAEYLARQPVGSAAWTDHWSGTGLPLLVRIGFIFSGAAGWPALVAAPAGAEPANTGG